MATWATEPMSMKVDGVGRKEGRKGGKARRMNRDGQRVSVFASNACSADQEPIAALLNRASYT